MEDFFEKNCYFWGFFKKRSKNAKNYPFGGFLNAEIFKKCLKKAKNPCNGCENKRDLARCMGFYLLLKAVDKAADISGANVATDHAPLENEQIGVYRPLIFRVIGYGVGVSLYRFACIFREVEALLFLQLVIGGKDLVKGGGDLDGRGFVRLGFYLPPKRGEKRHAILVCFDPFVRDHIHILGGDSGNGLQLRHERDQQDKGNERDANHTHKSYRTRTHRIDKHNTPPYWGLFYYMNGEGKV